MEAIVGQHKRPTVVGFEIVDLFAKDSCPEVFADKLDTVQRGCGSWLIG